MLKYADVDPRTLYVSTQRPQGADPARLHRQLAVHGRSMTGMPVVEVEEDPDGKLVIVNGTTRATRVAMLFPGLLLRVAVMRLRKNRITPRPTIGDLLPQPKGTP